MRFQWRLFCGFLIFWSLGSAAIVISAIADTALNLGWGLGIEGLKTGSLFFVAGGGLWLFGKLIRGIVLSYTRHTYGPDPSD